MHWHHVNTRIATKGLVHTALFANKKVVDIPKVFEGHTKTFGRSLLFMEHMLKNQKSKFLANTSEPTIADLLIIAELDQHMPEGFDLFDYSPYPTIQKYIQDVRGALPKYDKVFSPVIKAASSAKQKEQYLIAREVVTALAAKSK